MAETQDSELPFCTRNLNGIKTFQETKEVASKNCIMRVPAFSVRIPNFGLSQGRVALELSCMVAYTTTASNDGQCPLLPHKIPIVASGKFKICQTKSLIRTKVWQMLDLNRQRSNDLL
jgi:hypothetical protein